MCDEETDWDERHKRCDSSEPLRVLLNKIADNLMSHKENEHNMNHWKDEPDDDDWKFREHKEERDPEKEKQNLELAGHLMRVE